MRPKYRAFGLVFSFHRGAGEMDLSCVERRVTVVRK